MPCSVIITALVAALAGAPSAHADLGLGFKLPPGVAAQVKAAQAGGGSTVVASSSATATAGGPGGPSVSRATSSCTATSLTPTFAKLSRGYAKASAYLHILALLPCCVLCLLVPHLLHKLGPAAHIYVDVLCAECCVLELERPLYGSGIICTRTALAGVLPCTVQNSGVVFCNCNPLPVVDSECHMWLTAYGGGSWSLGLKSIVGGTLISSVCVCAVDGVVKTVCAKDWDGTFEGAAEGLKTFTIPVGEVLAPPPLHCYCPWMMV